MTHDTSSPDRASPEVPFRVGWGSGVVLLLTGATIGLLGAFLQAVTVELVGVTIPVGLVVVLATLIATIRAVIHAFDQRLAGVFVLAGWGVLSVLLAVPWPGGDVVIARSAGPMVYLFGGAILGSAAANVPARLRIDPTAAPGLRPAPEVTVDPDASGGDPTRGQAP